MIFTTATLSNSAYPCCIVSRSRNLLTHQQGNSMSAKLIAILSSLELADQFQAFHKAGITDDLLDDLSNEDLVEIGISSLGDRKLILKAIRADQHSVDQSCHISEHPLFLFRMILSDTAERSKLGCQKICSRARYSCKKRDPFPALSPMPYRFASTPKPR